VLSQTSVSSFARQLGIYAIAGALPVCHKPFAEGPMILFTLKVLQGQGWGIGCLENDVGSVPPTVLLPEVSSVGQKNVIAQFDTESDLGKGR
jgi:hypothetical protein